MSIETKIEDLTRTINELIKVINHNSIVSGDLALGLPATDATVKVDETQTETTTEEKPVNVVQMITHDELKKYCLAQVRENPAFKDQLASAMEGYGVKTLGKLKAEHVQTIAKMIGMI